MRKRLTLTIILLLCILLTACSHKKDTDTTDQTTEVKIYCLDTKTSDIVSENYTPISTTKEALVGELLEALKQTPKNIVYKSALPDNVTVLDYAFSVDNGLTINFDSTYSSITGIPEVICRAMVVKTLSQIDGVDIIEFNVNGQQLLDSNGAVVGLMTGDTFIENIGDEINYKVSLYFANEEGTKLIKYISDIYDTGTVPIEEQVINQLINGPTAAGMYRTIPEGTILLNITTKERICYVDFNEKFLEKVPNVDDDVVIYSVVNSLVEVPDINKVQFSINGESLKTYRENIAFDGLFERNLSLAENGE